MTGINEVVHHLLGLSLGLVPQRAGSDEAILVYPLNVRLVRLTFLTFGWPFKLFGLVG